MTVDQAKTIYKSKYWDALGCDDLPSGVDYTVFDYGVNSGLARPRNDLKKFKSFTGAALINAINDERVAFLKRLEKEQPKDLEFDKGWMARVSRVRAYSLSLAKDNTSGPVAGTATLGLGATLSQYFHTHEGQILIGTVLAAILIGTVVHMIRNGKK